MQQTDDFYLVLPSNASPDTHPTNNASQFTVRLAEPIHLDDASSWKVAMIEMGYSYHPPTLSRDFSIKYKYYRTETARVKTWIEIVGRKPTEVTLKLPKYLFPYREITKTYLEGKRIVFESPQPFQIEIINRIVYTGHAHDAVYDESKKLFVFKVNKTLWQLYQHSNHGTTVGRKVSIHFTFYSFIEEEETINFPQDVTLGSANDLVTYIINSGRGKVFKDIRLDKNGLLALQLADRVSHVKLQGGLNFVLGFVESEFHVQDKEKLKRLIFHAKDNIPFQASAPPNLTRGGMQNMFIKADICKPVLVGSERMPLLRNLIVDTSQDFSQHGSVRKHESCPLVYVDVSTSFITQITFNTTNQNGFPVIFPDGSVTIITLHFKKL